MRSSYIEPSLDHTRPQGVNGFIPTCPWPLFGSRLVPGRILFVIGTVVRQNGVTGDTYARRTHAIQAVVGQLPSQGASALMVTSFRTCLDHSLAHRSPTNTSLPMVERVRSSEDLLHQVWRPCALDEVRQQQGTAVEACDRALLDVAEGRAMTAWNAVPDAKRF